ncbi:uncharacterized protein LOC124671442 [Lolium rigidum]|uniref:uncharacterized protein LOC124671442 n=1 Tax=Lolium rigidum TaxID=89674 RepID=UPI001F5CB20F|nr:uncharacterized protein LOC124671442 [Lolium rigidum]
MTFKTQNFLEASMDRSNISFYDLVKLIEGVGFSGIDYLYYRKKYPRGKGHLVHIDNDTHVRKMITEHNKEKRVQLYVYKEMANIDVAPSEPQGEDDGPITSFEEEDAFPERATQTRTSKSQTMVRKSKRFNVVQSRARTPMETSPIVMVKLLTNVEYIPCQLFGTCQMAHA